MGFQISTLSADEVAALPSRASNIKLDPALLAWISTAKVGEGVRIESEMDEAEITKFKGRVRKAFKLRGLAPRFPSAKPATVDADKNVTLGAVVITVVNFVAREAAEEAEVAQVAQPTRAERRAAVQS